MGVIQIHCSCSSHGRSAVDQRQTLFGLQTIRLHSVCLQQLRNLSLLAVAKYFAFTLKRSRQICQWDKVATRAELARRERDIAGAFRNLLAPDAPIAQSEAIRLAEKPDVGLSAQDAAALSAYRGAVDAATKFIPTWVKVAVAIALGLGTMVGWKRIVVTVGEKIGKTHLTYAQGASAEVVAMLTIGAADLYGLPVSTTHVLSSGVAGTMAANRSGLQWATVRNLVMAWVLTLPAAVVLAGVLYWIFRQVF